MHFYCIDLAQPDNNEINLLVVLVAFLAFCGF